MYNFDKISILYDKITTIETLGFDNYWRKYMLKNIKLNYNSNILDSGSGTGKLTNIIYNKFKNCNIYAMDYSEDMLKNINNKNIIKIKGDVLNTEFKNDYFDLITSSFLIRPLNNNLNKYFIEMNRILKKNKYFVIMEIYEPENKYFKLIFDFYFHRILKYIGNKITKSDAFTYFSESVKNFYNYNYVSELLIENNFKIIKIKKFLFGTIIIHYSIKL